MNKRLNAKLGRLKYRVIFRASIMKQKFFDFSAIISLAVYIAVIPLIMELLESLSNTLTGTAGLLLSAIIGLVPLILVIKVLDKLSL